MILQEKLYTLRSRAGLTQEALAENLEQSPEIPRSPARLFAQCGVAFGLT